MTEIARKGSRGQSLPSSADATHPPVRLIRLIRNRPRARRMSSGTEDMPHKPPFILPEERERLSALGQRLRFARLRRGMSGADMAEQACVSRATVFKVETGDPGATLGTYFRVLNALRSAER